MKILLSLLSNNIKRLAIATTACLILSVYSPHVIAHPENDTLNELEMSIIKHEGVRTHVYLDTEGHYTIGIGSNLSEGLTYEEMVYLMRNDILHCQRVLSKRKFYLNLNKVRQDALVEMCYNMGASRLMSFKKMIHALTVGDYELAYNEALDSKWALQVGAKRSTTLAHMLKTGRR